MSLSQAEADSFVEAWGGKTPVSSEIISLTATMLLTAVRHAGCSLPETLPTELKNAQGLFILELLQKRGEIASTTGEIRRQTQGKVTTEMQQIYPLFFFGGKDTSMRGENIASLLAHMSYWQLGNWIIYNWCEGDLGADEIVQFGADITTRGAGWNDIENDS